jgi:PKD repeat protein
MKKLLSSALFLFTMIFMVGAQNATLSVTGHVTDDVTGAPIQNHLVLVSVLGGGMSQDYEFYTNDAGFYGSDSIPASSQGLVRAATIDCIGEEHAQEAYFYPGNYSFVFDFEICNDSIPSGDCENWFWYETNDNITFDFYGESFPYPANEWIWDFGDGETGYGQNITHTYDTTLYNIVWVTLTTVSYDPNTADSCIATSTQVVWVGNQGSNCQANFEYTIDSVPTGAYVVQFTDLSIGDPTFWMWDFGDGTFSEEQNPEHIYDIQGTYLVCLTIFSDSMNNCYDTYCEEIVIGSGGGGGCENFFWYFPINNTTFTFYGEAVPVPADEYLWDFGDGTTGSGQQIDHTFDPNMGNVFLVTLTTIGWDITGDTCVAESMQAI